MDDNTTALLIAVAVPMVGLFLKYLQDRRIARDQAQRDIAVAAKVEEARKDLLVNTAKVDVKLDGIHTLVNSRLTEALEQIEALKAKLLQIAPDDPRVQSLVRKGPE